MVEFNSSVKDVRVVNATLGRTMGETKASGVVLTNQAEEFLKKQFGPAAGSIQVVGQGEWSTAYTFRLAEINYVIRFSAFRDDFAKDRFAGRYSTAQLPIPEVLETGGGFSVTLAQPAPESFAGSRNEYLS